MLRQLQFRYRDGQAVSGAEISLISKDQSYSEITDSSGRVEIECPEEFLYEIACNGIPVRKEWDIGNRRDLGEFRVARPEEDDDSEQGSDELQRLADDREHGIRGIIYYHDGTRAYETMKVKIMMAAGGDSQEFEGQSSSNGSFYIRTGKFRRGASPSEIYIDGERIANGSFRRNAAGFFTVVLKPALGRGKGTKGGIISGRVVNRDGSPASGATISADTHQGGVFSFFGSGQAKTKADGAGFFILPFEGSTSVRKIFIDGHEPLEMRRKERDEVVDVNNNNIPAGTFNLRLVRYKRAFSLPSW